MQSGFGTWLYKQLYCRLIGTVLPVHWFGPKPPAIEGLSETPESPHLQIVSHCWQYAHLSVYQLSSLANFPPESFKLTYTLYYAAEDEATARLAKKFAQKRLRNITWQWIEIPRSELFRRAIGRNRSALATTADWIWFADCDLIFHDGCLESVIDSLKTLKARLAYPASEQITELLPAEHPIVNLPTDLPQVVDIDPSMFRHNPIEKAKGAFQIVHGDVARHCGYCKDLSHYQTPTDRWRKTFEDTAFRKLIADEGTPIPVTGLHRIRHQVKGRYAKDSIVSDVRKNLRQLEDNKHN